MVNHKLSSFADTITAIATAPGSAGISVIRISGNKSRMIADKLFKGKIKPSRVKSHTIHYGRITNPVTKQTIDEVMISVFLSPHSYTGEDMIEISCHGGDFIPSQILQLIIKTGARLAEPGEFTRRRVLAGKMDLTQAEAILDLTCAQNESAYRSALEQLQGRLSGFIQNLSNDLKKIITQIEYLLEFEESENIAQANFKKIKNKIKQICIYLNKTITQNQKLKFLLDGVYCVIVGKPNVGKSSLFNRLIESDKAIITEIAGTTRDSIKETVMIDNIIFHFIDTAGLKIIRQGNRHQKIEAMGIQKSKDWLAAADFVLAVFDNSQPINKQDHLIYNAVINKPHLFIINKIDRPARFDRKIFKKEKTILVSTKFNKGLNRLKTTLKNFYRNSKIPDNNYLALNERHLNVLNRVYESLKNTEQDKYIETVSINLRNAITDLSNLTHAITNEQILDSIFSKFCIGK